MKRTTLILLTFLFTAALHSQTFYKSLEPDREQMAVYVGSFDWGPCVTKVVINTEKLQKPEELKASDFELERYLHQNEAGFSKNGGELTVTQAFCSDALGNKIEVESNFITLITDVYPEAENSSPFPGFISSGLFNNIYDFRVTNDELDLEITKCQGFVNEAVTMFSKDSFTYEAPAEAKEDSVTLPYMYYFPQKKDTEKPEEKIPLILWLHTIGESGNNPYLVLLGVKATALAGEKIQSHFENGAAILTPQCPTGWLETTEASYMGIRVWAPVDIDGAVSKVTKPFQKFFDWIRHRNEEDREIKPFAAVSYYTDSVTALLMEFLEKHPEIDRDRIYVGGASAGGYMTMNMMIQHPELFAAAFPTCEYYLDSKISNEQIKGLAKKPLWFTYAENDETVKPENNSIPTIQRLKKAGASNLKVSAFSNVIDTSGTVLKNRSAKEDDEEYGLPYEYEGHASWIYLLNDQCRDGKESLFDWLSRQRLHVEK